MRNLFKLLYKYHFFLLFLAFQIFSLVLIIRNNNYQRAQYIEVSGGVKGQLFQLVDNIKVYLSLKETNYHLALENADLKNKLSGFRKRILEKKDTIIDTLYRQQYTYFSAKVVNNSVNKQYNFITINKGYEEGVRPDMAVVCPNGVVGVVTSVSYHYATVMPIINLNFKISAQFKKNNFFGSLSWDGLNSEYAILSDIPHHVKIQKGDTLISTEYSGVFPEGIPIATIEKFEIKGNFYTIKVRLTTDFRKLYYVTIIDNLLKPEKHLLESKQKHD